MKILRLFILRSAVLFFTLILASKTFADTFPQLKVMTYNAWGLSVNFGWLGTLNIAHDTPLRLNLICEELKNGDWDFVFLQEIWRYQDRQMMKNCGYPYVADQDSYFSPIYMESGLLILSRYPILHQERLIYPVNGMFKYVGKDGEYAARKSGLFAKIQHPDFGDLWLATTHLVSSYQHESYQLQRQNQFRNFLKRALNLSNGKPLIIGGDFNFNIVHSLENASESDEISPLLAGFSYLTTDTRCTSCMDNEWNQNNEWDKVEEAGVLDFILGSPGLQAISGGLRFHEKSTYYFSPKWGYRPLSDHYAWETVFQLELREQ